MRLLLLNALILVLNCQISLAQETFKIANASRHYDLMVQVEAGGGERNLPNVSSGAARVSLYRKGAKSPFQILNLENVEIDKDQTAYNPEINKKLRKLYDDEYSFIFGDFNFDGKEDLAICNGRNGGYGAPSYNVFLYNSGSSKFVENKRLSRLTEETCLGLFFVDPQKRQLITFSKSGCCYHETRRYRVANNRPVLVEKTVEAVDGAGDFMVTTTRSLINGGWIKRVRRERMR